jgi:glycosyltransferase involved in cell wall biosynthesis
MNNSNEKLVSIIVAAYNIEKYISQTIESILGQTYKNIEVIIVNDGSTDGTLSIVEEYAKKDPRIVVVTQTNKGVSGARNTGFKKAKGDYFCIVDADDILLPTKIESQYAFLNAHMTADFAYSKVYYFIDGTSDIYTHDLATASGSSVHKKLLSHGNFIYTSTVFFRRKVFDEFGGFDEGLRSAEEFDYWLLLSEKGVSFVHQNEYLTLCRSRNNGLTSDSVTMYTAAVAVLEKHLHIPRYASYQYLKSSLLLYISKLRKSKVGQSNSVKNTVNTTDTSSASYYINRVFTLLKKIKFSLTFKKVHNKQLEDYLIAAEKPTIYESTH